METNLGPSSKVNEEFGLFPLGSHGLCFETKKYVMPKRGGG
jgi:hypothetical protein